MNKILKYVLNHKKRIIRAIAVIIIGIILFIICISPYPITLDDGTYNEKDSRNVPAKVGKTIRESTLFSNRDGTNDSIDINTKISKDGGYALDIDLDEITDNIIEDLDKHEGRLNQYLSKGNLHEYLKKMIKAEFITQYPDLRNVDKIGTEVPEDEFQGVIKFIRHKSDGSKKTLEYIPLGDKEGINVNTLYGLINTANGKGGVDSNLITQARNKIMDYFSIDINGNLIIANWKQTITKTVNGEYGTEYKEDDEEADYSDYDRQDLNNVEPTVSLEYSTHAVNYRNSISKYTVPFNYLWAFLVCGHDEEFVSDFADIVLDSEIEISIYDNLTETEDEKISSYNENEWKSTRIGERTLVDGVVERR